MQKKRRLKPSVIRYLYKILIVIIITLILLIIMKSNNGFKADFYKYVYDTNFSFADVNKLYNKYFKTIYEKKESENVMIEKLAYNSISAYKDGAKLVTDKDYSIPIQESGIVVYIGNKDEYGKVVIIQQNNGIDMLYGNIDNVSVNLYDYVTKGSILGNCKEYMYVVYKKNGEIINYAENI